MAEYEYLADGTKLRAVDGSGNGYQYRGSLIYTQTAGQSGTPAITLDCALTSAGRIVRENTADGSSTYKVQHYLRDHLGSVRSVIDGDTGAVVETNDYYPFGKRITPPPVAEPVEATSQSATSPNRWLFSGKESQSFLYANIPLLDFGASQDVQSDYCSLDNLRPYVREVLRHQPVCLLPRKSNKYH